MIPEWVRRWPHPGHGYFVGYKRRCETHGLEGAICPTPRDKYDWCGKRHDDSLRKAKKLYDDGAITKNQMNVLIEEADRTFAVEIRENMYSYHSLPGDIPGPIHNWLTKTFVFRRTK